MDGGVENIHLKVRDRHILHNKGIGQIGPVHQVEVDDGSQDQDQGQIVVHHRHNVVMKRVGQVEHHRGIE